MMLTIMTDEFKKYVTSNDVVSKKGTYCTPIVKYIIAIGFHIF